MELESYIHSIMEIYCGLCSDVLVNTNEVTRCSKNCILCKRFFYIHTRCARQFIRNLYSTTYHDLNAWNAASRHHYYCKDCEENCFFVLILYIILRKIRLNLLYALCAKKNIGSQLHTKVTHVLMRHNWRMQHAVLVKQIHQL